MSDNLLTTILTTPEQGIFALEFHDSHEVKIVCSIDLPTAILRESKEIKRRGIENVVLKILEISPDPNLLWYHWNQYRNKNWALLNTKRPPHYTLVKRVQAFNGQLKFFVLLKSGGNKFIVCGIFTHESEADEFMILFRGHVTPFYGRNYLTRCYYKTL